VPYETVHETFQEAAKARGLIVDDNEAEFAMQEAVDGQDTPRRLGGTFCHPVHTPTYRDLAPLVKFCPVMLR
jgi:hypothetical protein